MKILLVDLLSIPAMLVVLLVVAVYVALDRLIEWIADRHTRRSRF